MPALVVRWLVRWCMQIAVRVEIAVMTALCPDPRIDRAIDQRRPARSQARRNLNTHETFVPDFKAIFHSIDRKLVSFMEVTSVEASNESEKGR
jgi:hypothetical protein